MNAGKIIALAILGGIAYVFASRQSQAAYYYPGAGPEPFTDFAPLPDQLPIVNVPETAVEYADPWELWGSADLFSAPVSTIPNNAYQPYPTYAGEHPMSEAAVTFSDAAVAALKTDEGFSAKPYRDAGGWSIGYGHYMGATPDRQEISESDAHSLLLDDMNIALATVALNVRVPLTQNQLDALVRMTYNLGPQLFRNSDGSRTGIWRALDAGDYAKAADEMLRWNKSEGRVNPVLVARRERERLTFIS